MKALMRGLDAMATGLTVGERISEGEPFKAIGIGLGLAFPLIMRRRIGSLTLAVLMAVGSYYFWEKVHGDSAPMTSAPTGTA
ncbi:hypothetical protein BRD56_06180 [Thermoplasmatales archaeon SW_10_69_26]|jgi:hypothetical protein|nr:MAG: hypothetical protein BRD56_06180 [Thermoplasmatales archaeon SW_10_69_26]